jgi:hypothetical protein
MKTPSTFRILPFAFRLSPSSGKGTVHISDLPAVPGIGNGYIIAAGKVAVLQVDLYDGDVGSAFNNRRAGSANLLGVAVGLKIIEHLLFAEAEYLFA